MQLIHYEIGQEKIKNYLLDLCVAMHNHQWLCCKRETSIFGGGDLQSKSKMEKSI